jgi:uncharacterized protein YndB with AHSA1/START domain
MTPIPTGRLFDTAAGTDLVLTRSFRAAIEDVWASVTEPERTARWFGPWAGEGGPGRMIKVQMLFEDGAPSIELRIDACEPPRRLALAGTDEFGSWRIELLLSEAGGSTELRFVQHLADTGEVGEIGPGWEYYLDNLVASRTGSTKPGFGDYYPALKPYFEDLTTRLAGQPPTAGPDRPD